MRSALPAPEFATLFKIPTASNADEELLGTGEPSYVLKLDVYKTIGRVTPYAVIGPPGDWGSGIQLRYSIPVR